MLRLQSCCEELAKLGEPLAAWTSASNAAASAAGATLVACPAGLPVDPNMAAKVLQGYMARYVRQGGAGAGGGLCAHVLYMTTTVCYPAKM